MQQVLGMRAWRLALGTALCTAINFGMDLPLPMVAPAFAVFLFASLPRPLPLKAGLGLLVLVALTTGSGMLLVPLLRYYLIAGVLLVGLCLFLAFAYGLRGGSNLVATFLAAGLTMISAAGTADQQLAMTVIKALVQGLLLAVLVHAAVHAAFPESAAAKKPPAAGALSAGEASRLALRATLVVLPAFLFALADPSSYMPIIMKSVSLGRQSCTASARGAARELLGSTLMGGLMAISCWFALRAFVHLWMFFLWMLLFALFAARRLYRLAPSRQGAGFWLNAMVTMIILLAQSVQDSVAGKDVYTAFAVRMGLFIAVTGYASAMVWLLDTWAKGRAAQAAQA
ncbi:DUF2955 domain-containing protein [Dyella terrae]|uniref:DUF2955 domain-containing protein n=3 Tax=Dyella TaxID=231454 RepID=A0A4R0YQ71_9GAMM|nr:DUF2955 domain-containing protein [Dyella soli]TBR36946.1 DUF2955 domain-containing protein [Dyella terrae]TCI07963.1 DUF2955 domain-containing protein [Dyella soli]